MTPRTRPGFTLVELTVATAVTGLLLAAIATAMTVAAKATPDDDSPERLSDRDRRVAQEIARELSQATAISQAQSTSVTFTVPDRTGDAVAETITYALAGTAKDQVARTFNGTTVTLADKVTGFTLGYTTGSRAVTAAGPNVEGPEQVLSACYETAGGSTLKFDGKTIAVQKFRPILPANAVSWRVTTVNVYLKQEGSVSSSLRLQIYATDLAGNTTGSALSTLTVSESALPASWGWHTFTPGNMTLTPSQGAAVLLANSAISVNLNLGLIAFQFGTTATAGAAYFVTDAIAEDGVNLSYTTSGSSFNHQYDDSLAIEISGRITTTTTVTSMQTTIDAATISLASTGATPARASTLVPARPAFSGAIEINVDEKSIEVYPDAS
ncbi:MAG: hypothetical protein AMXMBFR58_31030 [Phycisphaerae bacterium]|nr:hypothetical protein [Phycisphaerales bacterium]